MTKTELHASVGFIDLQEEELKAFILFRHESLKDLDESKKEDQVLKDLTEKLKDYVDVTYATKQKAYKAELKAARSIAKARGIHFDLPKD